MTVGNINRLICGGVFIMAALLSSLFAQPVKKDPAMEKKIAAIVKKMTVEEKVGQMTQITLETVAKKIGRGEQKFELDPKKLREAILDYKVGSILNVWEEALYLDEWHELIKSVQDLATKETRLGIPIIYGIDAIHGATYTREATLFPQSLAMAATFNPELVHKSGEITALEVRASGIPWNFNPVLGVGRNPLWPRLFETFGEDTYTVSRMGEAYVKGLQGDDGDYSDPTRVAACMKHYLGYSVPLSGKDRTPAWIPERMLRDIFLPPFKQAVEAGVGTVMLNSGEINGIPTHGDYYLVTEILRNELKFDGLVVSDWEDIKRLYSRDRVAENPREAVKMGVMAGVDMSMVPFDFSFFNELVALVNDGEVPMSRIDEAVTRILRVKFRANLFEKPYPNKSLKNKVALESSRQASLESARQVMTLLKNENEFLPLSKNMNILISGPNADLLMVMNSGWTYTWQGNQESLYPQEKHTILEAITEMVGKEKVTYVPGTTYDQEIDIPAAVAAAKGKDVAILAIGEMPYCETPGNINDLSLPEAQINLVKAIQETGTPVVLVLTQGRPRIITPVVEDSKGILMAYLPGLEGGQAIAEVLFGEVNPSGRLPISYPKYVNSHVPYDLKPLEIDDPNKLATLWPFGHGLSYTEFTYSDLTLSGKEFGDNDEVIVNVTVSNTGMEDGREIVHLFLRDDIRSVSAPVRQLRGFQSVPLKTGQSKTLTFKLDRKDFLFHDRQNKPVVEAGKFTVMIGDQKASFHIVSDAEMSLGSH